MEHIITKLRAFIFENFLFDAKEEDLLNETSFLEQGIIDSTGVLELVDWIEDEFELTVEDDEVVPENLDSINQLATYIGRKKTA